MSENRCGDCSFRAKYDSKPTSIAGRFWRWHINVCPGWKKYFMSLPSEEKISIAAKYDFNKYQ